MQVSLFTRVAERDWDEVKALEIPDMQPPPSVIVWGERVFMIIPPAFSPGDGTTPEYGEVFAYVVPEAPRA